MLAKKYRLPVQSVLGKKGVTRRGRYFLIKAFPSQCPHSRLGVVVSGAVAPKASRRNQLKRIVYAAGWTAISTLPVQDYLAIALPGPCSSASADAIIKELQTLLS